MKPRILSGVSPWQHLIAVVTLIAVTVIMIWSRTAPIETVANSAVRSEVHPGDSLVVNRSLKWIREGCRAGRLLAVEVDAQGFRHTLPPQYVYARPVRTPGIIRATHDWAVPVSMPWGESVFYSWVEFSCPPFYSLWPILQEAPAVKFTVAPPP